MRPTVNIDDDLLNDVKRKLGDLENKAPQAISRAMNRALTNIASNISKEVRKEYTVKATDVKASLGKIRKSNRNDLSGSVSVSRRRIPLEKFKISPKIPNARRRSPYKAAVKKDGGTKNVSNAFLVYLNGTTVKFVKRTGVKSKPKKGSYKNKMYKTKGGSYVREKITTLTGPSVQQMLKNEDIREEINVKGNEMFYRSLDHEINRIIEKGRN